MGLHGFNHPTKGFPLYRSFPYGNAQMPMVLKEVFGLTDFRIVVGRASRLACGMQECQREVCSWVAIQGRRALEHKKTMQLRS